MEEVIKKCLTCGGDLEPDSKGIPTCKYCGRQYKDAVGEYSSELKEIVNRRQLREFIQAEELGRELLKKQPESSEVYWQILLASLGVVYVQADGKSKPTFFSYSYDDRTLIADNENYKNAIKYAKSVENRRYYEAQAQELDTLLKEFFGLVAKEASYDIFISFKRTVTATVGGEERQIDTDDYYKAKEIYEYLNKKYKVFFSPVSIGQDTGIEGEKYEPRILKALQTSQAMILLGSRTEYLEAQWVQNEWRRYQYFINKGKKNKSSLILGYEKFMPALPTALKDIQLPSFDWFKASYLKDLESKLAFVKTSKGIKSTIKERKISSDFGTDASFGSYTGKRVTISGTENIGIVLSPNEARELDEAGKVLQNGDFDAAKKLYDRIIHNNGNNSTAFWGRFKANIKARTDSEVSQSAATNIEDIYLKDIDSAIDCSTDEKFSWNIVDLLVEALKSDGAWVKTKIIFEYIIKYLDDRRAATALDYLINNAINSLKFDVNTAEDIFGSARKLFFDENKETAIAYMEKYAEVLFNGNHFNLARKYYEELASIKRSGKAYFNLLACRVSVTDLSKAKFALNVNPNDDASIKKPSELDLDEIIERILICNNEAGDTAADARVEEIALYQIQHNKNNCKPFIETIISCYAALDKKMQIIDFLMKVAERFIQIKDFKNAKLYYNEVLSHNPNYSKAHWGLLMVRFKAIDENDLIKHRKALIDTPEYQNAKNCADNDEFAHYTDILNGVKQYYKNPYGNSTQKITNPNKRVYKYLTRKKRRIIESVIAVACVLVISLGVYSGIGIANPLSYDANGTITSRNLFFDMTVSVLNIDEHDGKKIVAIGNNVFKGSKLKSVSLSTAVRSIGEHAFESSKLEQVTISNPDIDIGAYAFANCEALSQITIAGENSHLTVARVLTEPSASGAVIGEYAFQNTALETIEITEINSIGANAFAGNKNLKELVLNIEDDDILADGAFNGISGQTTVFVPSVSAKIYSQIKNANPALTLKTYTREAVEECIYFINEIGKVSLDKGDIISKAENMYENLTSSQKSSVTNYSVLQSSRRVYDTMKAIEDIGTVTLASNDKITAGENAYRELQQEEQLQVTNYAQLTEARTEYRVLCVVKLIEDIGQVTLDSTDKITAAENAYKNLTQTEQPKVTNYNDLTEARSQYRALCVIKLIEDIGDVTLDSDAAITAAENAYKDLKQAEQLKVTNYNDLTDARSQYRALCVIKLIEDIGDVTLDSNDKITAAENAYNSLKNEEKGLVTNHDVLTAAKQQYSLLKINKVIELINDIGEVDINSNEKITLAEQEYDKLSEAEQAQVENHTALVEARSKYQVIYVTFLINDIGEVDINSNAKITLAEQEYDKLSKAEQEKIENHAVLLAARSRYKIVYVIYLITDIGTVDVNSLEKITLADEEYEKLNDDEKEAVTNYNDLLAAKSQYKVAVVIDLIDNIGIVTENSNSAITNAEAQFEALTEEEQARVTNHDVLLKARQQFKGYDSLNFSLVNGGYSVSAKNQDISGELSIPQKYSGKDVIEISSSAFSGCIYLTSITIPETIQSIRSSAFDNCSLLNTVIWNAKNCISAPGFKGCVLLTDVIIGKNVQKVGYNAFDNCSNIQNLFITDLESYLAIEFESYSSHPFSNIKDHHLYIDGNIANSIDIPIGMTTIPDYAFEGCGDLKTVNISNDVTSIGSFTFDGCSSLTDVNIPSSVTTIGSHAFADCKNINEIDIPDKVTKILDYTFYNCSNLEILIIGARVADIDTYAFSNCGNLKTIYYKGSAVQWGGITGHSYLDRITRYYFSERDPYQNHTAIGGENYWHYNTETGLPEIWAKKEDT